MISKRLGNPDATPRSLAEWAVHYAAKGCAIFPCAPRAKTPLIGKRAGGRGFIDATADVETVRRLWTKNPNANIGFVPGRSGLLIVDVDGETGAASARSLGLDRVRTRRVKTARGWHYHVQHPGGKIGNLKPAPGIDIRADLGYTLLPPSIHPDGTVYAWENEACPIAELPPDLRRALLGQRAGDPEEAVGEGGRNNALASYLGGLRRNGATADELMARAIEFNAQRCDPPLGEKEVVDVARSIARYDVGVQLEDPGSVLNELNSEFAVVLAGAKVLVMRTTPAGFVLMRREEFRALFANRFVLGSKKQTIADCWFTHARRRQYEGLVYEPGRVTPPDYFNIWRGWGVEPRKGRYDLFLRHLRENIANGDPQIFRWVLCWFAQIFQQPMVKPGTALALRGAQGTGKTIVGRVVGKLLGDAYRLVADQRGVTGQFNAHLEGCLLLQADEAFWAGDKYAEGAIKHLVTSDRIMLERKGIDPIEVNNFARLLITSNATWVVPAGLRERRFCVLDVGEAHIQDSSYFAAIMKEMESGGYEGLLDYLLTFNIDVNLRAIPRTRALFEQQLSTFSPQESWLWELLRAGELPGDAEGKGESPNALLYGTYVEHSKTIGRMNKAIQTTIGILLCTYVHARNVRVTTDDGRKVRYTRFPSLSVCRELFAKKMGLQDVQWPKPDEWQPNEWQPRRRETGDGNGAF